jgi:hypothetical protein
MGSLFSTSVLVELEARAHIGHTFLGNAEMSHDDDVSETKQGWLAAGTRAHLLRAGVVELIDATPGWKGPRRVNIRDTRWRLVAGSPQLD